ncbi:MAG TPA: hypothetical protein VFU21_29195 [Kofleriaceae bacterium]|nr:hypothetical protein [Kofleriaceae bacterium]
MRTIAALLAVAAAPQVAAAQQPRASVLHVPPGQAAAGEPLRLVAVIDAAVAEPVIVARVRRLGSAGRYREVPFERSSAGGYFATVPAEDVARPGVEYYIAGRDAGGAEIPHFASERAPHAVVVEAPYGERLAESDQERMRGRLDTIRLDVDGHNFGNRYGRADYFLRSEIRWSHHFLRTLYAVSFGYGAIEGKTPETDLPGALAVKKSARFGFSEVRTRFHESVFLDARATLGVDRDDLEFGGSGALVFGRPWRSSFQVGGEYLRSMGPTAFVRLQWDTAPPFLMAASVIKTDLPDAVLTDGLYVKYDVSYPLAGRLDLRAAVSYGSRDGAAHWGGGAGAAVSF